VPPAITAPPYPRGRTCWRVQRIVHPRAPLSRGTSCPSQNEWRLDGGDGVRDDTVAWDATVIGSKGLAAAVV